MSRLSRSISTGFLSVFAACLTCPLSLNADTSEQEWRFKVYLDDKPIGHHHFRITRTGKHQQLSTQARFDVTFLKIPIFRYRHDNIELWADSCLQSIASQTSQNGDVFRVEGTATDTGFELHTHEGGNILPPCVSTFAYWDKSFLQHQRLLNPQTGEYLDVRVDDLGEQSLQVGKTRIVANRYKLTTDEHDIELLYSSNDKWVGLESITDKGRVLRYVME